MSIPRSKSAPHVGPTQSTSSSLSPLRTSGPPSAFGNDGDYPKPRIARHSSALVVTHTNFASTSSSSSSRHHSGHQSPRVEREEDPFSLSGFFPSQLALSNKLRVASWKWLRSEDEEDGYGSGGEDGTGEYEAFTGYVSPVSEEDEEWIPSTPGPIFDQKEDEDHTLEAIKQEDKLGILSLNDLFASLDTDDMSNVAPLPLVSPYSENEPLDSDGLYSALCALRRAHTMPPTAASNDDEIKSLSCAELFSPVEETDGEKEDTDLDGVVYQGLRRLFALLPF